MGFLVTFRNGQWPLEVISDTINYWVCQIYTVA